MTLIVDAGPLFAQADKAEKRHAEVVRVLKKEGGTLVTSEAAAAEADYLILDRLGIDVELDFLRDLAEGTFAVECLSREERGQALAVAGRYRDLGLGLADCSLVVLAKRFATRRILTLNERHFRAVTPLQGGAFQLLPSDGPLSSPA